MKTVRQLIARTSSQEGAKAVGAEYAVQNDRAEFLKGRGYVEIVGDAPDPATASTAASTAAPAPPATKATAKKKAARKGKG